MSNVILVFGKTDYSEPSRPFYTIGVFDNYLKLIGYYRNMRKEQLTKSHSNTIEIDDRIDDEINQLLTYQCYQDEDTHYEYGFCRHLLNQPK